ncbi:MAG: replication-relaxation family protein [Bacteroidota bacterium]
MHRPDLPGSAQQKALGRKSRSSFVPTERDTAILRAVAEHRLLRSRSHLVPLFGGSLHVLRRLQRLTAERYLCRLAGRPHQESVYAIGDKGSDLLHRRFGVPRPKVEWTAQNRTLTERHVAHTLLIADVLVGIELACRARPDLRFVSAAEVIERHASERVRQRAREVGGRPLRWRVRVRDGGWVGEGAIEPDGLFGIEHAGRGGTTKTDWYFLEADRGTMSVIPERPRLDRSSLFKKMLQYHASAEKKLDGQSLTGRHFGLPSVRTLFVLATGARGQTRLQRCLEASRHFQGGRGTGLFLFVKREDLLEATNPLTAPVTAGTGHLLPLSDAS